MGIAWRGALSLTGEIAGRDGERFSAARNRLFSSRLHHKIFILQLQEIPATAISLAYRLYLRI